MGRNTAISAARSGPRLWRLLSAAGAAYGDRGGHDRPPESVAESVRRAAYWEYSPRLPGPCDRPARAPSAAAPDRIPPLLSSLAYASGVGHGLSCATISPTAGGWLDQRGSRSGWVASPL